MMSEQTWLEQDSSLMYSPACKIHVLNCIGFLINQYNTNSKLCMKIMYGVLCSKYFYVNSFTSHFTNEETAQRG
jgi:hypothetical protein